MKLAGILLCSTVLMAVDGNREIVYEGTVSASHEPLPTFDKGYLLFLKIPPANCRITVYDPQGKLTFDGPIPNPKSDQCSPSSPAADRDGTLAVPISYSFGAGYAHGIVVMDHFGKMLRFIDTGRFVVMDVCFDREHTIWSIGWQRDAIRNPYADENDYGLVRRFSLDGKPLGEFIPRSLWTGRQPKTWGLGLWSMAAAGDKVGALVAKHEYGSQNEWIEWNLKGELLTRTVIDQRPMGGMAFTESGRLYAQLEKQDHIELAWLDTKTGQWNPVPGATPERRLLMAAQGNELVFKASGSGAMRMIWFRPE